MAAVVSDNENPVQLADPQVAMRAGAQAARYQCQLAKPANVRGYFCEFAPAAAWVAGSAIRASPTSSKDLRRALGSNIAAVAITSSTPVRLTNASTPRFIVDCDPTIASLNACPMPFRSAFDPKIVHAVHRGRKRSPGRPASD